MSETFPPPQCTFWNAALKVWICSRCTCTPMGYFLQMGVWCPTSVTIKHSFPQDDCAVKQQYFIHDSDWDLPVRLQWPFFSCTTHFISACLRNVYSLRLRSTWTQIVDRNPLATASDWLFAQLRDTPCGSAFLQGPQDTWRGAVQTFEHTAERSCQVLPLIKPS